MPASPCRPAPTRPAPTTSINSRWAQDFPDYPKWGIWPSGYFQTNNNFGNVNFDGAYVCGYNSAKLLVGDHTAEQICFQLTPNDSSLLPGDIDSSTLLHREPG